MDLNILECEMGRPSAMCKPFLKDTMNTNGESVFRLHYNRKKSVLVPRDVGNNYIAEHGEELILIGYNKNTDIYIKK